MAKQASKPSTEILLKEYEVCQSSIESLAANVWQTSAVIGLASVGTLALVATTNPPLLVSLLVGLFSMLGVLVWWKLAYRLWSVRDAKIVRMRHIEEDLDVAGQGHYVAFMDELYNQSSARLVLHDHHRIKELAKKYKISDEKARDLAQVEYQRKGPKDWVRVFLYATPAFWLLYLAYRLVPIVWAALSLNVIVIPFQLK
ncbi:MAG: hypothetical protein WBZ24_08775 [Anaerolineales bacterium]|jgi:hypothetical protein